MTTEVTLVTIYGGRGYETEVVEFPAIMAYGDTREAAEENALKEVREDVAKGCTPDPTATIRKAPLAAAASERAGRLDRAKEALRDAESQLAGAAGWRDECAARVREIADETANGEDG